MPVQFSDGKALFVGGKLAMDSGCCCDTVEVPCDLETITLNRQYTVDFTGIWDDRCTPFCDDCATYSRVRTFTFVGSSTVFSQTTLSFSDDDGVESTICGSFGNKDVTYTFRIVVPCNGTSTVVLEARVIAHCTSGFFVNSWTKAIPHTFDLTGLNEDMTQAASAICATAPPTANVS